MRMNGGEMMEQKTLRMTGLTCEGCTCGHCGQPIMIFLSCLHGVIQTLPDYTNQTVVVSYDEKIITSDQLIYAIQKRGYAVVKL
jgi:copper chaperone CopZ